MIHETKVRAQEIVDANTGPGDSRADGRYQVRGPLRAAPFADFQRNPDIGHTYQLSQNGAVKSESERWKKLIAEKNIRVE